MRLRKATQEDAAKIVSIDPMARTSSQRQQLLREAIATDTCWIALLGHDVTAYAILNYSFFCHGFIPLVYVGYRYRRQGTALKLMRRLECECHAAKLFTSTNRSNLPMRGLLAKLRYREVGSIDGLDEDDAEVFHLKILSSS